MTKKTQTRKNNNKKKGPKFCPKFWIFISPKKAPAATPPAEKTHFLRIKNLYGKKITKTKKNKKTPNF